MSVKMTIDELENLAFEGEMEKEGVKLTVVQRGEWTQEHKTQSREIVFTDGERFYSGSIGRSGDPWSGWTYDSEVFSVDELADITEVRKVTRTIEVWEAV